MVWYDPKNVRAAMGKLNGANDQDSARFDDIISADPFKAVADIEFICSSTPEQQKERFATDDQFRCMLLNLTVSGLTERLVRLSAAVMAEQLKKDD